MLVDAPKKDIARYIRIGELAHKAGIDDLNPDILLGGFAQPLGHQRVVRAGLLYRAQGPPYEHLRVLDTHDPKK